MRSLMKELSKLEKFEEVSNAFRERMFEDWVSQ
jgi:hypothetical protein